MTSKHFAMYKFLQCMGDKINSVLHFILVQAFKAMLGADSFVQAGWVHDLRLLKFKPDGVPEERYLIIGNVKHSQSMNATFCHPWFVAEKSGEIRGAHCDCMAG